MNVNKKKLIIFLLRFFTIIGVFIVLFKFIPYAQLGLIYKDSIKIYIILALSVFFLNKLISVWRWNFILGSLGVGITYREALYAYLSGLFLNLFLPSFLFGDIFRGAGVATRHGNSAKVVSSIIMDRFSGGVALVLLVSLSFLFMQGPFRSYQFLAIISLLITVVALLVIIIFNKLFYSLLIRCLPDSWIIKSKIKNLYKQVYFFRDHPQVFMRCIFFSLIIQALPAVGFFIASKAFGVQVAFINFLLLIPVIMLISSVPVTISGAGVREASLVYSLSMVGVDKTVALGISLVNFIYFIVASLLGGFIYLLIYHRWLDRPAERSHKIIA